MLQPDMSMLSQCSVEIQSITGREPILYVYFPKRIQPALPEHVGNYPESATIFLTTIQEEINLLNLFQSFWADKTPEQRQHIMFGSLEKGTDEDALLYALTEDEIALYDRTNRAYAEDKDPDPQDLKALDTLYGKISRDHILPTQMAVIVKGQELIDLFKAEHAPLLQKSVPRIQ